VDYKIKNNMLKNVEWKSFQREKEENKLNEKERKETKEIKY